MKKILFFYIFIWVLTLYPEGLVNLEDENIDFMGLERDDSRIIDYVKYEDLFKKGNDFIKKGDTQTAIRYFIDACNVNPNSPQVFFNLGLAYEKLENNDKAIESYKRAIELKNNYPKAHMQLAKLLEKKGSASEAIAHFKLALEQDPNLNELYIILAHLLSGQERFEESIPYFKKATELDPSDINKTFEYANVLNTCNHTELALEIYYKLLEKRPNDSGILYNTAYTLKKLGRIQDAMPYYQAALKRNPNHAEAHFSLGLAHLSRGNFKDGWPEYEWRWQRDSQLKPRNFKEPLWDGSPLHGKVLFIHCEQGLGDTFQFIRCVQEVKEKYGGIIVVAVQKPLETVITKCCPYIDRVIGLDKMPVKFDYQCPLMSLPLILKLFDEQAIPHKIPYIFPDPTLTEFWRRKLSQNTKFKVGICWQGNSKYSTPFLRAVVAAKSIKMKQFNPFAAVSGITLYSLQKETGEDQVKNGPLDFELTLFDEDFDKSHGRFMDTAAVIKNLDLVITVDTSIAHLAAAIGTPVWILIPEPPDWRWMLQREDTPWYSNMRLFRQKTCGDWDEVINRIAQELQKVVTEKNPILPKQQSAKKEELSSSSLEKELQRVENQLRVLTRSIKNMQEDDPQLSKLMRKWYLLSQLKEELKEKIEALEGQS